MAKQQVKAAHCNHCQAVMINGVFCHEHGCPDAWKRHRECKWCGTKFTPESKDQVCCCIGCTEAYNF